MTTRTAASEVPRSARLVQVLMTAEDRRAVRMLAARDDVSMAEWTRRLIAERLQSESESESAEPERTAA